MVPRSARVTASVIAALLLAASPHPALACGGLVSQRGDAEIASFVTMLAFDGTTEDVVTTVRYGAVTEDFGWLLPLPAPPTIERANLGGIAAAERISKPPPFLYGGLEGSAPGAVQELSRRVVGDLEFVVLRASGSDALSAWMQANGFALHDAQSTALESYLSRGWVVVAARLARRVAATADSLSVRLRFPTATLTYPLAMAGAPHDGTLRTTFYIVTPWRPHAVGLDEAVVRPSETEFLSPGARLELRYSAPLSAQDAADVASSVAVPSGAWLTRYDSEWVLRDLTRDLVLERSRDQSPVDFSGPDLLTPLLAALAIVIVAAVIVVARRATRAESSL